MNEPSLTETLKRVPCHLLIAELERRRTEIDSALESRAAWTEREQPLLQAVAAEWGLSAGSLFRRTRQLRVTEARQACMVILREKGATLQDIAHLFGMDHSTVLHACKSHERRMTDGHFAMKFHAALSQIPAEITTGSLPGVR
jgi:chromosomal replication initiation ATPase DnaA